MEKKVIKAAIYTRKSSEEGLDMDFNSLDAQREACAAYILSQKHEGWILVDKDYSDGGISGGTLHRAALQELLEDIKSGFVDIIVVYKIDRLTRSLHDFSKLVDIFDKYQTSFVSITQQFNTSTSMGRLTLNMLLSFAQFEREVTGERIRDKKLATAQKGMWNSGQSPFGYKIVEKKLIPNENEIENLNLIFEFYKELKSTGKLKDRLKEEGITTRSGKEWKVGALNNLLRRKTYIGKLTHKKIDYEGQHESILDKKLFNEVQATMDRNRLHNGIKTYAKDSSLLAGKLFDDNGFAMSPSHSKKNNKRYRYYLSQAYIQRQKQKAGSLPQIPAQEIEDYIVKFVHEKLRNILDFNNYELLTYKELLHTLEEFCAKEWTDFEKKFIVKMGIERIILSVDNILIVYRLNTLKELAEWIASCKSLESFTSETKPMLEEYRESLQLKRVNKGNSLIIGGQEARANKAMINLIRQSFELNSRLLAGESFENLLSELGISKRRLDRILHVRFLDPQILKMILTGTQVESWNTHTLYNCYKLDWNEQRAYFKI